MRVLRVEGEAGQGGGITKIESRGTNRSHS